MSAPYALAVDPLYHAADTRDALMAAADELRADLRRRAQEIVADPLMLEDALGDYVPRSAHGLAVQRAVSGDVEMLCGQVRTAAAKYALALHVREHDNPPQPVIDEALCEGWAPELPKVGAS